MKITPIIIIVFSLYHIQFDSKHDQEIGHLGNKLKLDGWMDASVIAAKGPNHMTFVTP